MLLIDPSLIRDRLVLDDKPEVNEVIRSAISGAMPSISASLFSGFDYGARTDVFLLDRVLHHFEGRYTLRLSAGFLVNTPTTPVVCTVSDSLEGASSGSVVSGAWVKDELGFVVLPDPTGDLFHHKFVRVSYTSGFRKYADVPDWLKEVAIAKTIEVLSMSTLNAEKGSMDKVLGFVASHGSFLLASHRRSTSSTVSPL